MSQRIVSSEQNYRELDRWIADQNCKNLFVVCDQSIQFLPQVSAKLDEIRNNGVSITRFSDFQPNPLYESVVEGVLQFRHDSCDALMAIGGGSAMDVAKCIKLYCNMPGDGSAGSFLKQKPVPNPIPFIAMPTTAGTGSEATRYAVIYYDDAKQSITSDSLIPGTVLLDPGVLKTLPAYQKKATMCDALCHAMESFWSVNSTDESRGYSREALQGVLSNMEGYLNNDAVGNKGMMLAANAAGKAINITQTTAGHAMCYKLTSLYRCAHGHAAMLCDRVLFPWMLEHTDLCIDPRGRDHLCGVFQEIAEAMGCENPGQAARKFQVLFDRLELPVPQAAPED